MIDAAPRLRVIARAGTGVDNVDVPAATARGIVVMNAPGANSLSVAELAMGFILSMARNIPAADASMKTSKWEKSKFAGAEIRSKALGLVGLGRIGQEVAARAHAFEMNVIAHDPFISAEMAATLGVELVSLDDLCARADYISLHVPALPSTKHLFNAERFAKCKKGVRIINTARGELIDEAALADAIERGTSPVPGSTSSTRSRRRTGASRAAAGRRDSAHRRVDQRGAGTGRQRDGRGATRFSQGRHHPQRRELPFRIDWKPTSGCGRI